MGELINEKWTGIFGEVYLQGEHIQSVKLRTKNAGNDYNLDLRFRCWEIPLLPNWWV